MNNAEPSHALDSSMITLTVRCRYTQARLLLLFGHRSCGGAVVGMSKACPARRRWHEFRIAWQCEAILVQCEAMSGVYAVAVAGTSPAADRGPVQPHPSPSSDCSSIPCAFCLTLCITSASSARTVPPAMSAAPPGTRQRRGTRPHAGAMAGTPHQLVQAGSACRLPQPSCFVAH